MECVSPDQQSACGDSTANDGTTCSYAGGTMFGFCHGGACLTTLDRCGDGVPSLALGELCDCGTSDVLAAPPPGCNGFNSAEPNATCRPDCTPAHCGDGIVDSDSEVCDDGNAVSGDGCRSDCGGRFELMQTPTAEDLRAVWTSGPTEAYAVGDQGAALYYDGTMWAPIALGTTNELFAVYGVGGDVYIGAESGAFLGHGPTGAWAPIALSPTPTEVTGIWASSADDVYLAGFSTSGPDLYHWDGASWTTYAPGTCSATSYVSVSGSSATDVYVAGTSGALGIGQLTYDVCHFDGVTWSAVTSLAVSLGLVGSGLSVDAAGAYAVVEDGMQTTLLTLGPSPKMDLAPGSLRSLTITGSQEILTVGPSGVVLSRDRSTGAWTHLLAPTTLQLDGVAASSPTNVFVVGASGTVLH